MSDSEIEVQITPRIREALESAAGKIGTKTFASTAGLETGQLDKILEREYLPVTIVLLACQINKSHGDTDPSHSSLSECVKGAIYRLPQSGTQQPADTSPRPRVYPEELRRRRSTGVFIDQKSARILGLSGSLASLFILFYFLGGLLIGPAFGMQQCVGIISVSPYLVPCEGSGIGLVIASITGLAYTTYFFLKKV